jgi:hypothetical protein
VPNKHAMDHDSPKISRRSAVLAGCLLCGVVLAAPSAKTVSPYLPRDLPERGRQAYAANYGVDQLSVKLAESGQLVRFSYRVLDKSKAAALNDKGATPHLRDDRAHVELQVPTMEQVGQLRQSTPPEDGKSYWMVFSNKGNFVKAGHRVSVSIGAFRADGLVVH